MISEQQSGIMPRRTTTHEMSVLMKEYREGQKKLNCGSRESM